MPSDDLLDMTVVELYDSTKPLLKRSASADEIASIWSIEIGEIDTCASTSR